MLTLDFVLPHLFLNPSASPLSSTLTISPQSSHCSSSPCYHLGPSYHYLRPRLLPWHPKWTPCFCPCLRSLITALEPECSFHSRCWAISYLCLEFPEALVSCRVKPKVLTLACKALCDLLLSPFSDLIPHHSLAHFAPAAFNCCVRI